MEGRLIWTAVEALKLDVNAVLDFGFWNRAERAALHWLARSVGATARTVYLPVDPQDQLERVSARWQATPEETWEITAKDLTDWRATFEEPDEPEQAGAATMSPPGPYADWGRWIDDRWPSAGVGRRDDREGV
ncbi:AAA family ATPase [Pseudonocardia acaciae]|uniref:AAA family ATPase n=1 Tax=Pseudonocardia acaciae TaxID=551276 RepID=UPI0006852EFC|nr:AAA family ATPase [Pseudonocardia acaciae]